MPAESIRVLIADDDLPFTMLARSYLESSGFEVVDVVVDGRRAVEACRRNRPDAVLLDVVMAELDGMAVTRHILREVKETTVIMLSAMTHEELIDKAVELDVTHYHVKPISRDQLRACVLTAVAADRRCKQAGGRLSEGNVVERGRGLVREDLRRIIEPEAYRLPWTESKNRRISIHEPATAILMAEDFSLSCK